ncbi:MAG: mechanosensitive ion channel domain-containing protein [Gemmatimonadota bacterium]
MRSVMVQENLQDEVTGFIEGALGEGASTLLNDPLFTFSGTEVTLMTLVVFSLIVLITFWLSRFVQGSIARTFRYRGMDDEGTIGVATRLAHYAVMAFGLGVALDNLGIDLAALFAAGALFAVAIGFAMQNIAQNFVSGLILLFERTIKPGDVLEVEGRIVRVERMGLRSTVARSRDEAEIILPNSLLVQNSVINYTLRDSFFRLSITVGVVYGADMRHVVDVLTGAASALTWRLQDKEPQVLMTEFGDSAVLFDVHVWTDDPWRGRRAQSDLNQAVWWALKDAGITIAFPQLDVHFDPPVEGAARRLAAVE